MIVDLLFPLTPYHWLVLALLLLGAEMLGAAGFLLGAAAAAFVVGILMFMAPDLTWHWQVGIFSILALALSVWYWIRFRRFNTHQADHELLNDRAAQLIGRRFTADRAVAGGSGKLRIGDTLWSVRTSDVIDESATVEVIASDGMTLDVRRVD